MTSRVLVAGLLATALGACASTTPTSNAVGGSLQQPLRDLNVVRDKPVDILAQARAEPYRPPAEPVCASVAAELAQLDAALGRDVDGGVQADKDDLPSKLVADAIGDLVGLPYRGVVRRLTGADRREREQRAEKLAGSIRRGFLKGWARSRDCLLSPPL